jgi:hypothetical protein
MSRLEREEMGKDRKMGCAMHKPNRLRIQPQPQKDTEILDEKVPAEYKHLRFWGFKG